MEKGQNEITGYVYILEPKGIYLPLCKIGRTAKSPRERCAEINSDSTGDLLWEVAYEIAVSDCKEFELLVHEKLEPLRQKRREFFNIDANAAYSAVKSILKSQSIVKEIGLGEIGDSISTKTRKPRTPKPAGPHVQKRAVEYASLLQAFAAHLGIKGRPFGQLNKPVFGLSDGAEGVQWNIAIFTDTGLIRTGVNLEGQQYVDWPIREFILSELENPRIDKVVAELDQPDSVFVRFVRDAWQVQSRPNIVEQYLVDGEPSIEKIDGALWNSMLTKALGCLSEEKGYRGRSKQTVTLASEPKRGPRSRSMWVSPHLTIWTAIGDTSDVESNLEASINRLKPVYEWVSRASR